MKDHPYTRYAKAVVRVENELSLDEELTSTHLLNEIVKGVNSFRMKPSSIFDGKDKVRYSYVSEIKGDTKSGIFLSPNVISPDKQAKNIWVEANAIAVDLKTKNLTNVDDIKMSIAPSTGEFLIFSMTNSIGRGKPKATLQEIALNAISSLTTLKPCFQYRVDKKPKPDLFNVCIIPDIPLELMIEFIILYKRIIFSKTSSELMMGDVKPSKSGAPEPKRPLIFRGNFPNPPRSSALGSISLLGAIGEFAKEAGVSTLAQKVLDSLKGATMYMITYGDASSFTYSHHVIDLAKEGKLRQLVDGIYFSQLYNEGRRSSKSAEYQKFDLFSSRFLQLFNRPAFKDFLSFRAEYPHQLETLFNTYFKKTEMIDPEVVSSARQLGRWLNQVAYFAAKSEIKQGSQNYREELTKAKAKVLVELESSTFSAKTGDALIAQAITRAGRISGMDAPEGATLFMEKTASGELAIDNAKNLLIAFSRLKNKVEQKELPNNYLPAIYNEDAAEETEDLSND